MPEHQRPLKVFLSYASQDKPVVRELSRRLASEGWIDPWVDEKKLLPGQDWRTKIEEAVETSDVVIICISTNSVTKEGFVQKELRYAREIAFEKPDETIFLIPLRLDDCTVPRGLRFYQWADYFGEQADETYSALLESLKLRYDQKLKIEEELVRRERERQEREAAEKAAREQAKREAAEKAEREKAEKAAQEKIARDLADKAKREKTEHEAAERVRQEKLKRDAAEKSKRERAELLAAQLAMLREAPSKYWKALRSNLPRVIPFLRIAGFAGIVIALFWLGSWGVPKLASLMPTPKASSTPGLHPSATVTFTVTPPKPTKTLTPEPIPTKTRTPAPTALLAEITDAKSVTMRRVPAGEFTMGSETYDNEKPIHQVYLDAFYMDIYEVTNVAYKACVTDGVCDPPQSTSSYTHSSYYGDSQFDDYPVVYVDWNMAKTYCEWRGGSLPTEAQWEKAARGADGRIYPWGEGINCNNANYGGKNGCIGDTTKVGSYESGISPYGIYDMVGNVWEWTADWYLDIYYQNSPSENPLGPDSGLHHTLRGGSWASEVNSVSSAHRMNFVVDILPTISIGFRCVRDVNP